MPIHQLTLLHPFQGDPQKVYNYLLDLRKFGALHPYMKQVEITDDRSPAFIEYEVEEEVKYFGFIPGRPNYKARVMELKKDKHIRYTSQVKPNVGLQIDLFMTKTPQGLFCVEEHISLDCNRLVGFIFMKLLKKAHLRFFNNLSEELKLGLTPVRV